MIKNKLNVLIVDENDAYARLHTDILQLEKFNTIYAGNIKEFAHKIFDNKIDLIILDLDIQNIGLKLLNILKTLNRYKNVPVIMTSLSYSDNSLMETYETGASTCLEKPMSQNELLPAAKFLLQDKIIN